jgi:hypothetical protein
MFSYRDLFVVWIVPLVLMGALTAIRDSQHGITEASDPYLPADHASQSDGRLLPVERELPPEHIICFPKF